MTRWPGQWPGAWPGDWQGGQEASPFANLSAVVSAQGSLVGTLEAVSGAGRFADMAMLGQGGASLTATLAGAEAKEPPLHSLTFAYATPRRRRAQADRQPEFADCAAVIVVRSKVTAAVQVRRGFDMEKMLAVMAERTTTEHRKLRSKRDEETLLALL